MSEIEQLQKELDGQSPRAILKAALARYDEIAISFSGAEDVALIEMAHKLTDRLRVFSLDTGRLHPETYESSNRSASTMVSRLSSSFRMRKRCNRW